MAVGEEGRVSPRRWVLWGLGNLLIVAGLFAILYVGGLYAYERGQVLAPTEIAPTAQTWRAPALVLTPTSTPPLPLLNQQPADEEDPPPPVINPRWESEITHLAIPGADVDSPVVEVGWHTDWVAGQLMTVWDVASYAVGHHHASGNPGDGTNIVLAGHSGGLGAVFRRLINLQPGDEVLVQGTSQQYLYVVEEIVLVQERNVPLEERLRNARYMAPTPAEQITMITCWPVGIYDHRLIVLARPYRADPFPRPDLVAD